MRQAIGNLLKLAVLVGLGYMLYNWQSGDREDGNAADFARSACLDEAARRYDVTNARVYEVTKNARGYAVSITVTLSRGPSARVTCIANAHGGVTDMAIDER